MAGGPELVVVYLKAFLVLLVLFRLITFAAFGQLVSGILAATLAYALTRRSDQIPQQVQDIAAPLNDLKSTPYLKLAASLIIDILGTRYVGVPVILQLVVGASGWVPIATFFVQFLYDRPALTAIDLLKATVPFANLVPTATLGFLLENGIIKEEWLGGRRGPFLRV
jgi:hypothetical protein